MIIFSITDIFTLTKLKSRDAQHKQSVIINKNIICLRICDCTAGLIYYSTVSLLFHIIFFLTPLTLIKFSLNLKYITIITGLNTYLIFSYRLYVKKVRYLPPDILCTLFKTYMWVIYTTASMNEGFVCWQQTVYCFILR